MAETKARHIANLVEDDGDVKSAHLDNITVTPTAVSDQANTSTGYLDVPSGTTAQRPGTATSGNTRFNSTTGSLEFYDGNNWVSTNLIPTINSITGTIYATASSTLTLSVANATDTIDVKYFESGTLLATDSGRTVSSGSATSTVPSAVYGQTAGDTISIQVLNSDGTPSSNNIDKTVIGVPSGGTKSTSGNYHIHTFTTSGTFTNTINNLSVEYLIIAGGASGGGSGQNNTAQYGAGGGGAGGYRTNVSGQSSGGASSAEAAKTIAGSASGTSHTVTVGGGGSGVQHKTQGNDGTDSDVFSVTSTKGGGGGYDTGPNATNGSAGGSGGGGGGSSSGAVGGAGTNGQGHDGGDRSPTAGGGGGGGGSGSIGGTGSSNNGGDGGNGTSSNITGSAVTRAGGGGGGVYTSGTPGSSGSGGGGAGAVAGGTAGNGQQNTGSGGGGGSGNAPNTNSGSGGGGIVIIRYQLP